MGGTEPVLGGTGATAQVLSEIRFGGIRVQEIEYIWTADADMTEHYPRPTLFCRLHPYRVLARVLARPGMNYRLGRMSFFPANSTFWAKAIESEDVRLIRCDIDPDWLEDVTQTRIDWRRLDNTVFFDLQNIYIERTMHRLATELSGNLQGGRTMAEALSTSIAVDLVRQLQPESIGEDVGNGVLSNVRLGRIQDFVYSFVDGPPSPAEVAAQAGLSTTYLRRVFKNTTGQTLNQFLEQTRIARARGLLAETTLPLKVVSHALGFARPSAFSVAFKRATGEVPKEYRRRVSVRRSSSH